MNLVSLLFGYKGRINRAQFWIGNLGAGVAGIMLLFLLGVMFIPTTDFPKTGVGILHMMSVMGLVLLPPLGLIGWISVALQTKRLHDRGRSGLWTMLPLLPGFMISATVFAALASGETPEQAVSSIGAWMLVTQAINLFMFIDLGCMPGKPEPNKYGPPPGGGGSPSAGPNPQQSVPRAAPPPIPGMSSALVGAESAIDRAIAAQAKPRPRPAAAARASAPAPSLGLRPATASPGGSFGRKAPR